MSLLSIVSPAHLGSGDDVQPRNTEALVTAVDRGLPEDVKVDIVGTDTFVRIRSVGHEVEIRGYNDEPYIEVDPSGAVRVNTSAITYLLNQTRYGSDVPSIETDDVTWEVVSTDGEYMWHDHRVHWMSTKPPATMNDDGLIQEWVIPINVDDQAVTVSGQLYLRDGASRLWWAVGFIAIVLTVLLSLRQRLVFIFMLLGLSVAGVFVGAAEFFGLPTEARITPLMLIFSAVAALLGSAAVIAHRIKRDIVVDPLIAGMGLTFLVLTWQVREQVTAYYIPGLETEVLARVLIPCIFGAGIVALVDGVRRVVFPDLDREKIAGASVA